MKTTVYTILIVTENEYVSIHDAKRFIQSVTVDTTFYAQCGDVDFRSFRAALDTANEQNPIDFKVIALQLQNQGFFVQFHEG